MQSYKFDNNAWKEDFVYAVGPHTKDRVKYIEENGILRNEYNEKIGDHETRLCLLETEGRKEGGNGN